LVRSRPYTFKLTPLLSRQLGLLELGSHRNQHIERPLQLLLQALQRRARRATTLIRRFVGQQ
jgi:hypothetical protein